MYVVVNLVVVRVVIVLRGGTRGSGSCVMFKFTCVVQWVVVA